jgi:DNA-binding GntR family transcriptional regulator
MASLLILVVWRLITRMTVFSDPRRYVQVASSVRGQIMNGTLRPGDPVPPLAKLTAVFSVGRRTARHAVQVLVNEELVWYVPGLGYYVRQELTNRQKAAG